MRIEAKLWGLLDELGVPFRQTKRSLIARFGSKKTAHPDTFRCVVLDQFPLGGQCEPLEFSFNDRDYLDAPPHYFTCDMPSDDWQGIRSDVTAALRERLGRGRDYSRQATLITRWDLGLAHVEAESWRAEWNGCTVEIYPGWFPAPTREAIATVSRPPDFLHGEIEERRHCFDIGPSEVRPPRGIWVSNEDVVVCGGGSLINCVPRDALVSVESFVCTPARGGGSSDIRLHVDDGRSMIVASSWDFEELPPIAYSLSRKLDVPLVQTSDIDA